MLAIWARPTTTPIRVVVIATAPTAATYGTRRRITSRLSTAERRTGERSLGHARHREARGDARERGRVTRDGAREQLAHERAERGNRARAAGVHDGGDVGRSDPRIVRHAANQFSGLVEQRTNQ